MPALRQASMSSVPAGAVSFFPSTVKVTSGILLFVFRLRQKPRIVLSRDLNYRELRHAFSCKRARPAVQVIFEFLAKFLNECDGRHRGRIAKRAEGVAKHVFGQVLDVVDVAGRAKSGMEPSERLLKPVG